jgi:hypothetical protein
MQNQQHPTQHIRAIALFVRVLGGYIVGRTGAEGCRTELNRTRAMTGREPICTRKETRKMQQKNWYQPDPDAGHPNWIRAERSAFADPTAPASIYHKRQPVKWAQVAPYLVAVVALGVAVAVLMPVMNWRTGMQNQVNLLRHELATTQSQLATAADAGDRESPG